MTEDDARTWLAIRFGQSVVARIGRFLDLVIAENDRQNLISPASIGSIWARHAVDSAQLIGMRKSDAGRWIDIGTGGGFPGMIVALAGGCEMLMVEPRNRRAAFLESCCETLGLSDATVAKARIEQIEVTADTISARAVASVEKLLQASLHCATPNTRWVLPRGRTIDEDLDALADRLKVMFHVEHSMTDPESLILQVDRR